MTTHNGHLLKLGGVRKNWKNRYFALSNGHLAYFSPTATGTYDTPLAMIDVTTSAASIHPTVPTRLVLKSAKRVFHLVAPSPAAATAWLRAIQSWHDVSVPLTQEFCAARAASQWRLAYALLASGKRRMRAGESAGIVSSLAVHDDVAISLPEPSLQWQMREVAPDLVASESVAKEARTVSSKAWRDAHPPCNPPYPPWEDETLSVVHYRLCPSSLRHLYGQAEALRSAALRTLRRQGSAIKIPTRRSVDVPGADARVVEDDGSSSSDDELTPAEELSHAEGLLVTEKRTLEGLARMTAAFVGYEDETAVAATASVCEAAEARVHQLEERIAALKEHLAHTKPFVQPPATGPKTKLPELPEKTQDAIDSVRSSVQSSGRSSRDSSSKTD